jgi:hypothetical protein
MGKIKYKVLKELGNARHGQLETNYGTFETPMFMPVGTRATVKGLTPEQVKGRIKSLAKVKNADARVLMRIYMMERFLERVANSEYKDNFIIKGGMLVTAMVGVALRSTMDIDTSIRNPNRRFEIRKTTSK